MVPTHFICCVCENEFLVVVDKRKYYTCKKCKQHYELVPTKYGAAKVLVGKRNSSTVKEDSIGNKHDVHE